MEEKKTSKKKNIIIFGVLLIAIAITAIVLIGIKKKTKDNSPSESETTEEDTTDVQTTAEETITEEITEAATEKEYEYLIENVDIGYDNVLYVYSDDIFIVEINGVYRFVDKKGNSVINADYDSYSVKENFIHLVEKDKNDWELRDKNLNLIYKNVDYPGYYFVSYSDNILQMQTVREDYTTITNFFGNNVYDNIYLKITDDGVEKFASFSRDNIEGYIKSGGYFDGRFLVRSDELYLEDNKERMPLYVTIDGKLESYISEGSIGFIPRYIRDDKNTHLVLVNKVSDGEQHSFLFEDMYIFDRKTNTVIPDSNINIKSYLGNEYEFYVMDITEDYFIAELTNEEPERIKYVIFDKYTGKFMYEFKGNIYYDYDSDIWLVQNEDGKLGLMHKSGTMITDWYYDCSKYNGNVALVKKTGESPISVIGLEMKDDKYNVIEYSSNMYTGTSVNYSKIGDYFWIKNGDNRQLVTVKKRAE